MTDLSTWQMLALAVIFVWSGFVRSGLGFGGAALSLPLLMFVVDSPVLVLPIVAIHLLVFSSISVGTNIQHVNWRYLKKLLLIVLIPKLLGIAGLLSLPGDVLTVMVYAITLFYGVQFLMGWEIKSQGKVFDTGIMMLGGYMSGVSLVGAPPIVAVASKHLPPQELRETLFVLWFILVVLKLGAFVATDTDLQLLPTLLLLPFAAVGHVMGQKLHQRLLLADRRHFMRFVGMGLVAVTVAGLVRQMLLP